jgi:sec-independent protein translocase protein TatA
MTFALFQTVGATELLIVLAVVLVIFGPKRLPALGRMLGSGMREFKESITRKHDEEPDVDTADTPRRDRAAAELDPPAHVTGEPEPVEGEVVSEKR